MNKSRVIVPASLISNYNAVKLSPREVASTFVDPEAFGSLVKADNAILLGPRGSGKTTLLKMLQSEALEFWSSNKASDYAEQVKSTGVFIGADRLWAEQIDAGDQDTRVSVGNAAYSLHIAKSLIKAMSYRVGAPETGTQRLHLRARLSQAAEKSLAASFARHYQLDAAPPSLSGVSRALDDRLVLLGQLRRSRSLGVSKTTPGWLFVDAIQASDALTAQFNEYANEPNHRWCLLFDELELAPEELLIDLLTRFRGNSSLLDFKLSLAPFVEHAHTLGGQLGAIEGQDLDIIPLSGSARSDSANFTRRLFSMYLENRVPPAFTPLARLFGDSQLETGAEDEDDETTNVAAAENDAYAPGGVVWQAMEKLEKIDTSFQTYLKRKNINLDQVAGLRGNARASTVRKVRNIVVTRAYYRGVEGRRSRKTLGLYVGADALANLPDGNPRMAMALIRELSIRLDSSLTESVQPPEQSRSVEAVMDRFVALLRAQKGAQVGTESWSVVDLLDKIGYRLAHRIIDGPFSPDAPAGFRVDDGLPEGMTLLLQRALNAGALVPLDGADKSRLLDNIQGQSFRLSNLLAPRYQLPMRQGKSVPLSRLLTGSRTPNFESIELFDLDDWANDDN